MQCEIIYFKYQFNVFLTSLTDIFVPCEIEYNSGNTKLKRENYLFLGLGPEKVEDHTCRRSGAGFPPEHFLLMYRDSSCQHTHYNQE